MAFSISRETQERLETYKALLVKWQARINLVSADTLKTLDNRHFQDSFQLLNFLQPSDRVVVDFGSGAGFPGLVIAVARPDLEVHLIESDQKKCEFLKAVSRETKSPVTIHTQRIETLPSFKADVLTARAFAPLSDFFGYAQTWYDQNRDLRSVLLKGENWQQELDVARRSYQFDYTTSSSVTESKAQILTITNLSPA